MSVGKFFKNAGHSISHSSKSVGHLFSDPVNNVQNGVATVYKDARSGVSTVYHDGRSAVSYTGKHIIGDVDNLTSALSSPVMWIAIGGVALLLITRR